VQEIQHYNKMQKKKIQSSWSVLGSCLFAAASRIKIFQKVSKRKKNRPNCWQKKLIS
jgi:hypothetical protein